MQIKVFQNIIDWIRNKQVRVEYNDIIEELNWLSDIIDKNQPIIQKFMNMKISFFYRKKEFDKDCVTLQQYLNDNVDITTIPKAPEVFRKEQIKLVDFAFNLVSEIEEDTGIKPLLTGGCLIGAFRHGGFIPWDDDIDFDLMRVDFNKLIDYVKEKFHYIDADLNIGFSDHRQIIADELLKHPNEIIFSQKPSCLSAYIGTTIYDCLTVDFFPRDYVNSDLTKQDYVKYRNKFKCIFKDKVKFNKYFKTYKKEINNSQIYSDNSKNTAYGFGNVSFANRRYSFLNKGIILPESKIEFEGKIFYTMNKPEQYLTDFYGDYMKFPKKIEITKYKKKYQKTCLDNNRNKV